MFDVRLPDVDRGCPSHTLDDTISGIIKYAPCRFREVFVDSADYWIRIGAVTGILAIALQEVSDFSLQMPDVRG